MALGKYSLAQPAKSRLVSVLAFVCSFVFLPLPQLFGLVFIGQTWTELTDTGCPCQDHQGCPCQQDGENFEEELDVWSSARRCTNDRRPSSFRHRRPCITSNHLCQIASYTNSLPAIVGHQLASDLCAPLLI